MYVLGAEEYIYNMLPFIWGNRDMTYITHKHTHIFSYLLVSTKRNTRRKHEKLIQGFTNMDIME